MTHHQIRCDLLNRQFVKFRLKAAEASLGGRPCLANDLRRLALYAARTLRELAVYQRKPSLA